MGAYVPLEKDRIAYIRETISASVTEVRTLCDMAANSLLYAAEIQRLRGDGAPTENVDRIAALVTKYSNKVIEESDSGPYQEQEIVLLLNDFAREMQGRPSPDAWKKGQRIGRMTPTLDVIEECHNEKGELLWEGPYPFSRLNKKNDSIIRDSRKYVVISSAIEGKRIQTVVKEVSRG